MRLNDIYPASRALRTHQLAGQSSFGTFPARLLLFVFAVLAVFAASRAQSATALGQLAASMQPGTWAQLTVSNQNSVLGVGSVSGSMLHYSNSMPWNPISKVIEIMGADHNYSGVGLRHVRYDDASNQFVYLGDQAGIYGHGYDHLSLNPTTGDLYWRMYTGFSGTITAKKKAFGTSSFVDIPSVPAMEQVSLGTIWWSGPFAGAGSQGSFMVFNSGNADIYTPGGLATDGQIVAYNPQTNSWFYNQTGRSPFYSNGSSYTFGSVMEYSPLKNVAVYGGGQAAPDKLWRLNADGSILKMPPVPSGKAVGIQLGNLVNDPVTGNFLLLSAGELWELNPDGAGTWTPQTGARMPPAGVGVPGPSSYQASVDGVISAAIPDYGVIVYVKQTSSSNGTVFVYKHGASVPVASPTVSLTSPTSGTVSGTVNASATASDSTGIAGVQFQLDGVNLSAEITTAPYSISWDTRAATNGTHTLTAIARNNSGAKATSSVGVSVSNAVDTTPDAFSFTAQSGVALNTAVTSNSITVSGINAAAPISVSGGSYSVNGAAYTTSAGTVTNGNAVSARLTSSSSNGTQTCATITIGGVSAQFCATTVASAPPPPTTNVSSTGGQDFATRCAQPGVVRCVGFDNAADFNIGSGGTSGAYGQNSGIFPPWGTTDYTRAVQDTTIAASGGSSLKFTIPSNANGDTSGSYFTNFSTDLATQFDAGQEFYVQWRQRFSPEFINTIYGGANGWKQVIVGTGDVPGTFYSSCTALELPVQNTYQRGFPQMYNSCTGSTSHGPYVPFEEPFGTYDFKLQNARPSPYCLYSQRSTGYFPPNGNCFGYAPNEWMTFQMNVKIGPRVNDEFQGSYIYLWGAREGQPSELLIQWGPFNLTAGDPATNQRFGKIWLLPYNTGRDATQTYPVAYTWYDELIISRTKIADPPYTGGSTQTTVPSAFGFTPQTGVAPSTAVTSNTITPAGYTAAAPISVAGGSYSINGGAFVTTAGTINPGQTVAVRQTSSSAYATTTTASLNIGGVIGTFAVTTQAAPVSDTTPDSFSFAARIGVPLASTVTSNSITISGINAAAPISVSGGSYSINGAAYTSSASTVTNGGTVTVQLTSSSANSTLTCATLTIGGVSGQFCATTVAATDTVPDTFGFIPQSGVPTGTAITSNSITVTGINAASPISISGGSYSVNGSAYTSSASTVNNGSMVTVRLTSSSSNSTQTCATLTIGGVPGQFCVTTVSATDTVPDTFLFTSQSGVATGTTVTSNSITVSGINAASPISVSGGSYSVNGAAYTSSPSTVNNGSTATVRLTSSSSSSTQTCATLTIGGVSGQFCVKTVAAVIDTVPDAFGFAPQSGIATGTAVTSNTITPTGYNAAAPISVAGGSYSINGGSFVATAGTINPGQSVAVRQTSSSAFGASTTTTLTIGGVAGTFVVTTGTQDTTPNGFSFSPQSGVPLNTAVTSNTITVTGINSAAPISVSGGSYSVNGAAFITSASTVTNNSTVAVRLTSASTSGTQTCATLTVGGVGGQFCVTTVQAAPKVKVTRGGRGRGTVMSNSGTINCGMTCSTTSTSGSTITLIATPEPGSVFTGWLGLCTGTGTCTVKTGGDVSVSATFAASAPGGLLLDIDDNGHVDASTDGVLVVRYLSDLDGPELIVDAIGPGATATTATAIRDYLTDIEPLLDIDGDGKVDPQTDGQLLVRYMSGLRNGSLIKGAVSSAALRNTPKEIEKYMDMLMKMPSP